MSGFFVSFQEELYQTCVEPMLNNVFDGYNVTIFAYGQTVINRRRKKKRESSIFMIFLNIQGSGKTYSMTGGNILSIGEKDYGIVPRAVKTIFDTIQVSQLILYI